MSSKPPVLVLALAGLGLLGLATWGVLRMSGPQQPRLEPRAGGARSEPAYSGPGHVPYDATLAPALAGTTHEVKSSVEESEIEVAKGSG